MKQTQKGKVVIAGAGPGDPELITLKTLRYLQQADVILTDRLVSAVLLDEYANREAEIIYVGKQCRRGASTPQKTINQLLVHYAGEGKLVLRLKGGDVSIFSNILDELQTLTDYLSPQEDFRMRFGFSLFTSRMYYLLNIGKNLRKQMIRWYSICRPKQSTQLLLIL